MMVWQILFVIFGAFVVITVSLDVFITVLHPSVESRLSNRFQQAIWYTLRLIDSAVNRRKHRVEILCWGLPLMVAGLIVLWLMLFGVGFACIYYPWIGNRTIFNATNPINGHFFDALYYSGVTLATLGYGDIQPIALPFRALAVVEAVTGAVTVSAGVAYILAVYPALAQQRTIARALNAEVAGQSDALPMIRRYLTADGQWHSDLFSQMREFALDLLNISESHDTHSVLYFAHTRHVQHSFLRVLVTAQSLVSILRYGLSIDAYPDTVKHPHVLLLEQSLHYSLHQLNRSIHTTASAQANQHGEELQLAKEFKKLCRDLEQVGLTTARTQHSAGVPVLIETDAEDEHYADSPRQNQTRSESFQYNGDPDVLDPALDLSSQSPVAAYCEFRLQTDPLISAYATACGYTLDQVRASYSTTWWTGKP